MSKMVSVGRWGSILLRATAKRSGSSFTEGTASTGATLTMH